MKMKMKNRSHRYDINRAWTSMDADIGNIKSLSL